MIRIKDVARFSHSKPVFYIVRFRSTGDGEFVAVVSSKDIYVMDIMQRHGPTPLQDSVNATLHVSTPKFQARLLKAARAFHARKSPTK